MECDDLRSCDENGDSKKECTDRKKKNDDRAAREEIRNPGIGETYVLLETEKTKAEKIRLRIICCKITSMLMSQSNSLYCSRTKLHSSDPVMLTCELLTIKINLYSIRIYECQPSYHIR